MATYTYECQQCGLTSLDSAEFKKVEVQTGPIKFAYILCNEHAEELKGKS